MNESELLIEYAKAWNNLDASYLENLMAEDFIYESQWVFTPMLGRLNYLNYIRQKFQTIRTSGNIPTAEIGYFENKIFDTTKPCIILTQGEKQRCLIIESENGKMKRADLTIIPDPRDAIKLNLMPK